MKINSQWKDVKAVKEAVREIVAQVLQQDYLDITEDILLKLAAGTYYLRLQVDWLNEKALNEGTLTIYCSP